MEQDTEYDNEYLKVVEGKITSKEDLIKLSELAIKEEHPIKLVVIPGNLSPKD